MADVQLMGLLNATLQAATLLFIAALGELITEKSGILNLGVEGMISIGAVFCGLSGRKSLAIALRDGSKHPSPNSGLPEAAIAGALGIRLGCASFYSGQLNDKPFIGDNLRELELSDITQSQIIMFIASFLGLAGVISIELFF